MNSPLSFFEEQLATARQAELKAQQQFNRLAIIRLVVFFGIVFFLWLWNSKSNDEWLLAAGGALVLFLILMRKQQSVRRNRDFQRNLQKINNDEIDRLDFKFRRDDTGEHFVEKAHPYMADLDIFGKHSLYRLINRTRTAEGSRRLGQWLSYPADLEEILMRQEASSEFRQDPVWRQKWEGTAMLHEKASQQIANLRKWVEEPIDEELSKGLAWRWWSLVTIGLGVAWSKELLPAWPFLFSFLWHLVILKRYNDVLKNLINQTYTLGQTLIAYSELFELSESARFRSRWWKQRPTMKTKKASSALRNLGKWYSRLDFRNNPYFMILIGLVTFWDLFCLSALFKWKKKYGPHLEDWLDSLADTEAMNSISGYSFANPGYVIPQVAWEDTIRVEARNLGHPLIKKEKRVTNDFKQVGTGETILITGSNMSGKSTFLRTLGTNLVLAQAGAVVCADFFACAPLRIFSSMRTQDSLEESTSSFYAELKRLKQLLELADNTSKTPVFYLLDEILKGTNSSDRHRGAEALIRQLHPKQASGLVSTHDLELGEWGAKKDYVHNYHFRSDVEDGQLTFDYRLREGICQSFNASELMRMMGIEVQPEE